MTFAEAMHKLCPECQRPAEWHRLTETGRLYCLQWRKPGYAFRMGWPEHMKVTMPVKHLQKSPLPHEIGLEIQEGLTTYG